VAVRRSDHCNHWATPGRIIYECPSERATIRAKVFLRGQAFEVRYDREDYADVEQDVYVKLATAERSDRPPRAENGSINALVTKVVHDAWVRWLEREGRRVRTSDADEHEVETVSAREFEPLEEVVEDKVTVEEGRRIEAEVLSRFNEVQQAAWRMRIDEGLSPTQIANDLGTSAYHVKANMLDPIEGFFRRLLSCRGV
jgi:RNA polymerase sigma factor (sigma-70 family)